VWQNFEIILNLVEREAQDRCVDNDPYLWERDNMKTTVEIPDSLFRDAKAAAAGRGVSLKTWLTEALQEKLHTPRHDRRTGWPVPPPKLARGEAHRIQSAIDAEFSRIDPEDWK